MFDRFIEENIERDIKSFEVTDELYERYMLYCEKYNQKPLSRRGFAGQLNKDRVGAWYRIKGKPARWGVKLLPCKY